MKNPEKIISKMLTTDSFSKWLGIEVISVKEGTCELKMTIRDEMVNGFNNVHGGITYSFADSALAFAANSYGKMGVALDCSIHYPAACKKGNIIRAKATEISRSNRIGIYNVSVTNQNNELVASFKGTVYFLKKDWEV